MEENLLIYLALDTLLYENSPTYTKITDEDFSIICKIVKDRYGTSPIKIEEEMLKGTQTLRDKYFNKLIKEDGA